MKRPNILIIHTDEQRWDALGANGNPHIHTPNLDRLAREGVNFDHCFAQNPVCMPSRISLLAGQYASTLGLQHMAAPVPEQVMTLEHMLGRSGYATACIGKLHFLPHANRDHRELHPAYGFDHLEISDEPGCYEDAYRAWVRRKAPDQLDHVSLGLPPATAMWHRAMGINDDIVHPTDRQPNRAIAFPGRPDVTHSAFVAEQTMAYLERPHDTPFFLFSGFYSPHMPWVAPREFLDLYDPSAMPIPAFPPDIDAQRKEGHFSDDELRSVYQGYYAMVSEVDHYVGQIRACLEAQGLAEDTLVVFTSDHGDWLGEHLRYGKGHWAPDCVSRVPLILWWPGKLPDPGKTRAGLVECVDVAPTLLTLAGLPIPPALQGNCLLPEVPNDCVADDGLALCEYTGWKTLRTQRWHYVLEADGREMLFDLEKDPSEYHNVADEAASAGPLATLRKALAQRLIAMERPLPRVWPY